MVLMTLHSNSDFQKSLQSNPVFQEATEATACKLRSRRLRKSRTPSNHIQILRDHGSDIKASGAMIDVYAKLAEPETTGGIVILLERPSRAETTRYGGGYRTVLFKSSTLREVARLISLATNNALTIEDVTILDAFPLQPDDEPEQHNTTASSELLNKLLAAKRPDVVLSCFRAGHHEGLIRVLQHPGIGHESNSKYMDITVRSSYKSKNPNHKFKKVDAFHPSCWFTYHPNEDSFGQLLELQFAKAFGEWCGTWQEAAWMDEIRKTAKSRNVYVSPRSKYQDVDIATQMAEMSLESSSGAPEQSGMSVLDEQRTLNQSKPLRLTIKPLAISQESQSKTKQGFGRKEEENHSGNCVKSTLNVKHAYW